MKLPPIKINIDYSKLENQMFKVFHTKNRFKKPECPIMGIGLTPGKHYLYGSPKTGRSRLHFSGMSTGRVQSKVNLEVMKKTVEVLNRASKGTIDSLITFQEHSLLAQNQVVKFNNTLLCDNNDFIYKVIFMNGVDEEHLDMMEKVIQDKVSKFVDKEIETYLKK